MVQISFFPFVRHLRSEPSRYVMHWSRGKLAKKGRGLAYWFSPLSASIAEIPCDDRELPFLFHGRSADFQDVTVQGSITWRIADPERAADRVDFSVQVSSGMWHEDPLEQLGEVLVSAAQQFAWDGIAAHDVRLLLERGVEPIRTRIREGLAGSTELEALGIEVVAVSVVSLQPSAELERALQAPASESIQQQADEAVFKRRALAVEKERAISENELQSQIELATRESDLIRQRGENDKKRAREAAEAEHIAAEAEANRVELKAGARATDIRVVEEARIESERSRMEIYSELEPQVMMGLAAREFASKLDKIEHLNIGPDMLGSMLTRLLEAGSAALEESAQAPPKASRKKARGQGPKGE